MPEAPHVMVATPCSGGQVTVKYLVSVLALQRAADKHGIGIEFAHLSWQALLNNARNTLVAMFLDRPAATHLLFVDADQGFEPEQVFRLLAFGAEVSGAISPRKVINWEKIERAVKEGRNPRTAGLDYVMHLKQDANGRVAAQNGFAQATGLGTGFMLIARSALVRLCAAHPELKCWINEGEAESRNYFGLFNPMIDPSTGASLSEDLSFCKRWADLGGEIWIDTQSKLTHTGPVTFHGDLSSQFK